MKGAVRPEQPGRLLVNQDLDPRVEPQRRGRASRIVPIPMVTARFGAASGIGK